LYFSEKNPHAAALVARSLFDARDQVTGTANLHDGTGADLVDCCCEAWNKLVDQLWRIMSIGLRQWAHGF
jgi:hypothetical protein